MNNADFLFHCPGLVQASPGQALVEQTQALAAEDYLQERFRITDYGKATDGPFIAFRISPRVPDESDNTFIGKAVTVRGTLRAASFSGTTPASPS